MKLTLDRGAAVAAMAKVQGVVVRTSTIPILQNVLLVAGDGKLRLTANDLDMESSAECDAEISTPGSAAVPADKLYDILKALPPGGEILLESIDRGRVALKCGRSRFVMPTLPATDFPTFPDNDDGAWLKISGKDLRRLLDKTAFAISTDAVKFYFGGVYLHQVTVDGESMLRAVATDGHRMAMADMPAPEGLEAGSGALIPRKAVTELRRFVDAADIEVFLRLGRALVSAKAPGATLASKLIDGEFPQYQRVIPADLPRRVEGDVGRLTAALKRAAIMSGGEKIRSVKVSIEPGALKIVGRESQGGEAEDVVEVGYEGEPCEYSFNVAYLLDIVGQMEGRTIDLHFGGSNDAVKATDALDGAAMFIVMPLRV